MSITRRPSCPNCYGTALRAEGRSSHRPLTVDLSRWNQIEFRTELGKVMPDGFVLNVRCDHCPLQLDVSSFRRVWSHANRPTHAVAKRRS